MLTTKQRLGQWLFAHMPITRFLFDQIRIEVNAAWIFLLNQFSSRQRAQLRGVRAQDELRINVACGPDIQRGFVNVDLFAASPSVLRWDCRRTLPARSRSVIGIRVEHFLEHLEVREELPQFLDDCYRVLKPGGILRVIVPDARRYMEAYFQPDVGGFAALNYPIPFPDTFPTRMDVLNHVFHQWHEHRWAYDFENLACRLRSAGFAVVNRSAFRESESDLMLAQGDREVHAPYSLYVEAIK
jgi:predicted SAM-dependent methyltransferase